mmetsp:Transcript_50865/g.114365  ORF Transcript_50865/g.114365 Transcript_50865/m.114365 type:complete len:235 (+) Transcript_50865:630-1334(+)
MARRGLHVLCSLIALGGDPPFHAVHAGAELSPQPALAGLNLLVREELQYFASVYAPKHLAAGHFSHVRHCDRLVAREKAGGCLNEGLVLRPDLEPSSSAAVAGGALGAQVRGGAFARALNELKHLSGSNFFHGVAGSVWSTEQHHILRADQERLVRPGEVGSSGTALGGDPATELVLEGANPKSFNSEAQVFTGWSQHLNGLPQVQLSQPLGFDVKLSCETDLTEDLPRVAQGH